MSTHPPLCPSCGTAAPIVNRCGCDPHNLPTHVIWTIQLVKDYLPEVSVRITKHDTVKGRIAGRKNTYASVILLDTAGGLTPRSYVYAWETIVHSLNTNIPLTI